MLRVHGLRFAQTMPPLGELTPRRLPAAVSFDGDEAEEAHAFGAGITRVEPLLPGWFVDVSL